MKKFISKFKNLELKHIILILFTLVWFIFSMVKMVFTIMGNQLQPDPPPDASIKVYTNFLYFKNLLDQGETGPLILNPFSRLEQDILQEYDAIFGSALFSKEDISNWNWFVKGLKTSSGGRLLNFFNKENQKLINNYTNRDVLSEDAKDSIVRDLNNMLNRRDFYFSLKNVKLNPRQQKLKEQGLQDLPQEELQKFNRQIIESSFIKSVTPTRSIYRYEITPVLVMKYIILSYHFGNKKSYTITEGDISSWLSLMEKLKGDDSPPLKRIRQLLSSRCNSIINKWEPHKELTWDQQTTVIDGLNEIIRDKSFYIQEDFRGVETSENISSLLKKGIDKLSREEGEELNRGLLDSLFPSVFNPPSTDDNILFIYNKYRDKLKEDPDMDKIVSMLYIGNVLQEDPDGRLMQVLDEGSPLFIREDITDWYALIKSLKTQGGPASKRVMECMDQSTRNLILKSNPSALTEDDKNKIIVGMNFILDEKRLYHKESFEKIALGDQEKKLLAKGIENLSPYHVRKLNRLLLESMYPLQIREFSRNKMSGWFHSQVLSDYYQIFPNPQGEIRLDKEIKDKVITVIIGSLALIFMAVVGFVLGPFSLLLLIYLSAHHPQISLQGQGINSDENGGKREKQNINSGNVVISNSLSISPPKESPPYKDLYKKQSDTPTIESRMERPAESSQTAMKSESSSTKESPQTGTAKESPQTGTAKESPQTGTAKESPQTGTAKESPQTGTATESPQTGTATESPQTGTATESPQTGTAKESSQTESVSQNSGRGDSPFKAISLLHAWTVFLIWEFTRDSVAVIYQLAFRGFKNMPIPVMFFMSAGMYVLVLFFIFGFIRKLKENPLRTLSLQWGNFTTALTRLGVGLASYFSAVPVVMGLFILFRILTGIESQSSNPAFDVILNSNNIIHFILIYLLIGIIGPIFEEILFRGYLYASLRKHFSAPLSVLISAGIFAFIHFDPGALFPLFLLGSVLAITYERSGSLIPAIITHACWNSMTFIMFITLMN